MYLAPLGLGRDQKITGTGSSHLRLGVKVANGALPLPDGYQVEVLRTHNWGGKYWGRERQIGVKRPISHRTGRYKVLGCTKD